MQKKLKWFYIALFAALLLSVGLHILSMQNKYQHLQDKYHHLQGKYLEQALTHIGHIYVHKLNKYKADNGRYPDSLDALFTNYIAKLNLIIAHTSQLVLKEKYIMKDFTPEEKAQAKQLRVSKCSLWDDWCYEPDQNDNTFKLSIVYKVPGGRNTLEYSPELDDFFVGVRLSVFD